MMQAYRWWWPRVVLGAVVALGAPAAARAQWEETTEQVIMDMVVVVPAQYVRATPDGSVGFCFEEAPGRLSVAVQLVGESQPSNPAEVNFVFSTGRAPAQVRAFPVTRTGTTIQPETDGSQCWFLRNGNTAPDTASLIEASRYAQRVHLRMTWSAP
jgi:hypothetical protein